MSRRWFFKTKAQRKQEQEARAQQAWEKADERECRREAAFFAQAIPDALARIGIDHWLPRSDRPTPVESIVLGMIAREKVEILDIGYDPASAIYLRIDPRRLPYRSTLDDMMPAEVLRTVSAYCGREVQFVYEGPSQGAFFIVMRHGAIGGIPKEFSFRNAVLKKLDDGSRAYRLGPESRPLSYVVGVRENRKLETDDLQRMYHLLVAGSTGTGKTTYLHSILLQLLDRNSPKTLRLLLTDLKDGAEFGRYRSIPHLWGFDYEVKVPSSNGNGAGSRQLHCNGIVRNSHVLVHALKAVRIELRRRQKAVAQDGCIDIVGWNRKHPDDRWPYLLMVIDELAVAITGPDKKISGIIERYLVDILQRGRSSGIYSILSTQRPASDVVTGAIKANCDGRTAMSVPDIAASKIIVDCGDAVRMGPPGRALHMKGANKIYVQCPKVTARIISRGIKAIRHKWISEVAATGQKIELKDILSYALDNLDGDLSVRPLKAFFGPRGLSDHRLRQILKDLNGKPLFFRDGVYRVTPSNQRVGRRLEPMPMPDLPTISERGVSRVDVVEQSMEA